MYGHGGLMRVSEDDFKRLFPSQVHLLERAVKRSAKSAPSAPKARKSKTLSILEEKFHQQLLATGLTEGLAREYKFHEQRRWRFDFAWPENLVAVEIEGGVWSRGRHVRPRGFMADCEKYNTATAMGWQVYRFGSKDINSLSALNKVEMLFREMYTPKQNKRHRIS